MKSLGRLTSAGLVAGLVRPTGSDCIDSKILQSQDFPKIRDSWAVEEIPKGAVTKTSKISEAIVNIKVLN